MRRAAVVDIFDRVGLTIVPGQFWRYLAHEPEPGAAVARFLRAIGVVPQAVRGGDPDEIERANDILSLLVEVERAFDQVSERGQRAIEDAIFSGDYDRVREASRIVATYQAILALAVRWPTEHRPFVLDRFLADIATEASDPLLSTLADAAQAEALAATLDEIARRLLAATHEQERLRDRLRAWPDWPDADALALALARFDATVESLRTRIDAVPDALALLAELETINASLAARLTARGDAGAATGGAGRRSTAGAGPKTDWELATAFFGFDVAPTADAFKRRRRELEKRHHPSQPTGSDAAFQLYGTHRDLLMRRFGFAR